MAISTSKILDVLASYDIRPNEGDLGDLDLPEVGQVGEGETVYSTSIREVLGRGGKAEEIIGVLDADEPRFRKWWNEIQQIIEREQGRLPLWERRGRERVNPPEPNCAWYCPIHFFGHGWGIYIRESCILSQAIEIATFVNWQAVRMSQRKIARHLLRSAFYVFFLHEQFHHKVESLGFRVLVSTGADRYRQYKRNVYSRTYRTSNCLEETLANAESYRRLREPRYRKRLDSAILDGLRWFLKDSIPKQPPGYREGVHYLSQPRYQDGLWDLQSHVLDGRVPPSTPSSHWSVAPNMITSLAAITDDIYVVLPVGARPLFRPTSVDPGATVSSKTLEGALTRHYGYLQVPGGRGSHVTLRKPGAPTIILPGYRPVLSPGVIKHVLDAIGRHPISRLPELLSGELAMHAWPPVPASRLDSSGTRNRRG